MTTALDVPASGRLSFHRLSVRALRDALLAEEARRIATHVGDMGTPAHGENVIETYFRSLAYLARGIGT